MKPVLYPVDAQRVAIDRLKALLATAGRTEIVAADLPAAWTPQASMMVQVAHDGTPTVEWPIRTSTAIRVVVWGSQPTLVKQLAGICQGLLLASDGVTPGPGILPDTDDSGAYLASFAVNWSLYATP